MYFKKIVQFFSCTVSKKTYFSSCIGFNFYKWHIRTRVKRKTSRSTILPPAQVPSSSSSSKIRLLETQNEPKSCYSALLKTSSSSISSSVFLLMFKSNNLF